MKKRSFIALLILVAFLCAGCGNTTLPKATETPAPHREYIGNISYIDPKGTSSSLSVDEQEGIPDAVLNGEAGWENVSDMFNIGAEVYRNITVIDLGAIEDTSNYQPFVIYLVPINDVVYRFSFYRATKDDLLYTDGVIASIKVSDTSLQELIGDVEEPSDTLVPSTEPSDTSKPTATGKPNTTQTPAHTNKPSSTAKATATPVKTDAPSSVTTGEKNALSKANSYLRAMPFSYEGLIGQLKYEGFTDAEAKYGADHCGANWNEQALKKAKNYLQAMPFSAKGLTEQLKYDKFTSAQAQYGVQHCGANWKTQAAKKAKSYLDIMSFSRESLISQLKYDGFTQEEAVYGAEQNGF